MTRSKVDGRRRGVVYAADLLDHVTGEVHRADYVGQTRQLLRSRAGQHREDQPWSDLIVGDFYPIAEGMWTNGELDAAEVDMIRRLGPRMNYLHNEGNPLRIPKWTQREQRWERDDKAGRPRWVHPDERTGSPAPVALPDRLPTARRFRARWVWAVIIWVAAAAAGWLGLVLAGLGEVMPLPVQAWTATLVTGVGVGWWQGLGRRSHQRR